MDFKKALEALQKEFDNQIMILSNDKVVPHPSISTGSPLLDKSLGIGGFPVGKVVEIFGQTSSGKTTLALSTIAQAQKKGIGCAFIDSEHVLDLNRVKKIGVNLDKLLFSQPDYGEQALEMVEGIIRSGLAKVIVIDSVAALTPKAEIEGDMGDSPMASQARMMSQAMRKLIGITNKNDCTLIFTNQVRANIGMYGGGVVTSGGNALKFYASIRLEMRKVKDIEKDNVLIASEHTIKVKKNKFAPPFKIIKVQIGESGFDWGAELLDRAIQEGKIETSGSWLKMGSESLGQGRAEVIKKIQSDENLASKLKTPGA
jgi:recombination protein RecA